ncbi:LysR family transcriptional regulator [Labrys neptuniae]
MIPRRLLPSIALLTSFDAVARTGSVTAAARELNLTQGAVSRHVKALEEQLGGDLFVRERLTMRLTLAGDSYVREVRDALRRISLASLNFRANPNGGTLNLAVLPLFAMRWLAPRLPAFRQAHPEIILNLVTRLDQFDFRAEPLDAAIHFGKAQWQGAECAFLRKEEVMPVCSPDLLARFGFSSAQDLRAAPLLILVSRPDAWEKWLSAEGAPAEGVHGMMFDQFGTLASAAIAGLGIALMPTFLIEEELRRGELVPALDRTSPSEDSYYLVWPPERGLHPPLARFKAWLIAECART